MSARWPADGEALIAAFLKTVTAPTKSWLYTGSLREFHRYFSHHLLREDTLRRWLRSRAASCCLSRVILAGGIVDRFLAWLVEQKVIVTNPFTELSQKYGCPSRSRAAIIRALAGPKPSQALEALRSVPRYASHLGPVMRDHVLRMRSLGFRFRHESRFIQFDRFLQSRPNASREPLSKLVYEYAATACSSACRLQRIGTGNQVAKAMTRSGLPTPPIEGDRLLTREVARKRVGPHIYSIEQVRCMLEKARAYSPFRAKLRPAILYTMFVLAYCAGLRLGEIVRLEIQDVDLREGAIEVRNTKFFKSRRLPLSASALAALREYLETRRQSGASQEPEARLFVHDGRPYSIVTAGKLVKDVLCLAGVGKSTGHGGPRFHDLRHTFVVHRMMEWYRLGINPQSKLPYLAAYLGHRNIHSTLVYLTITQELLQHANSRFRSAEASVLAAIKEDSHDG